MNNSDKNQSNSQINQKEKSCFESFFENLNKKLLHSTKINNQIAQSVIEVIKNKNHKKLYEICKSGLPDDLPILRAYKWKINLGYLPIDPNKWNQTLSQKRNEYNIYKKFIKDKLKKEIDKQEYKSKDLLEQIIKDVYRTNTQLSFFSTNK